VNEIWTGAAISARILKTVNNENKLQ